MVAIAVLFLGTGLEHTSTASAMQGMTPGAVYAAAVTQGLGRPDPQPVAPARLRLVATGDAGLVLMWVAAALTAMTGLDYFRKSLPYPAGRRK
jgi:hypothetical protein